jgi:predicted metal-dependent HD superfamily phosphohydrolase
VRIEDLGLFDELVSRYGEPHRHYHSVEHLHAVVTAVSDLAGRVGLDDRWPAVLAAWFHDAVYDPRRSDNEAASADLAADALRRRGCADGLVDRVHQLVLATVGHGGDDTLDAAVLFDADLAILAAPPPEYDRYAEAVRAEFSFVPDDAFRAGRARILRSLLDAPLYRTAPMQPFEDAARDNVERELRSLD